MSNPEVKLTLDDGVAEVLHTLTGMNLTYDPRLDRYYSITRALNKALRFNALEHDWAYYHDMEEIGTIVEGDQEFVLRNSVRMRIIRDDAVQLWNPTTKCTVLWALILPRDALEKYNHMQDFRCAVTRNILRFNRPFTDCEAGLILRLPVMREPKMFRLPQQPGEFDDVPVEVPIEIRQQELDFDFPDVIVARAAYIMAQSDPVMQPRAQTLEGEYKDLMYQLIERDDLHTDDPYLNPFTLGISGDLYGEPHRHRHLHPHANADERFG